MKASGDIDLGLGILDHQLLDSEGRRCGNVDDLELAGVRQGQPRVVEILVGVAAWRHRGRVAALAARLARGNVVHVPWSEVAEIASAVELSRTARELRLGLGDDRARRLVESIPGAK